MSHNNLSLQEPMIPTMVLPETQIRINCQLHVIGQMIFSSCNEAVQAQVGVFKEKKKATMTILNKAIMKLNSAVNN